MSCRRTENFLDVDADDEGGLESGVGGIRALPSGKEGEGVGRPTLSGILALFFGSHWTINV